jgi:hypothetical protein
MTREQIEDRMNELARRYLEAHDPKIPYELYKLARELEKIEKEFSEKTSPCALIKSGDNAVTITREEIEQKMDELAREYVKIHDPDIPVEIYKLARQDHRGC